MTANQGSDLFFVILSINGLDASIADFSGDEDALKMPKNPDASYRYDSQDAWEKDADVDESQVLRDDNGVLIFSSRSAAHHAAISYLENDIAETVKQNVARLRNERNKLFPRRISKRKPAPAATAN